MPNTPCPKCASMRTEQRPLFTGMYTHCLACDEGKANPNKGAFDRLRLREYENLPWLSVAASQSGVVVVDYYIASSAVQVLGEEPYNAGYRRHATAAGAVKHVKSSPWAKQGLPFWVCGIYGNKVVWQQPVAPG